HLLAVCRLLIRLLLDGHACDVVFALHRAVEFRKEYGIVRIPETAFITLLNRVTVAYPQEGTVRHVVGNEYPLSFRIHQLDLTGSSHHHPCRVALCVGGFNEPNAFKFHDTIELRLDVGFDGNVGGSTPYVEGTQGKLCTRLADRLGGDNAHRFAGVYHFASRQIAAIALGAASHPRFAGEQRPDLYFLNISILDLLSDLVGDLGIGRTDQFVRHRIVDVVHRNPSEDTLRQRFDDIFVVLECRDLQAAERTAVVFGDHEVLCHVYETTRQVASIGRLQRRVGKTRPRTVRGDKVLEYVQTFPEIGKNRVFDDGAYGTREILLRLGHQPAHTAE